MKVTIKGQSILPTFVWDKDQPLPPGVYRWAGGGDARALVLDSGEHLLVGIGFKVLPNHYRGTTFIRTGDLSDCEIILP